jgi:hypothetical protein
MPTTSLAVQDQALGSEDILDRSELHARLGMDPRVKPEDDEGGDAKGALPPMR